MDWFQPYKHTNDSVGVIYLILLNIPQSFRHNIENIIFVGVIPGPKEPLLTLNSYLAPLVQELNELWFGQYIKTDSNASIFIKVALALITCDIPALKKVSGFLGYAAVLGCSRCLKRFDYVDGRQCCGGFKDQLSLTMRNNQQHRRDCQRLSLADTRTMLHDMEMEIGVRYSLLLELMYLVVKVL